MRIALMIEYDGSRFHGWQSQPGLRTVQSELERAVAQVANHEVSLVCAGRTDTGVHATHQIVHFDAQKERSMRAWVHGANSFLANDVSVKWAKHVSDDFHARFKATSRAYRYVIYNSPIRPALLRGHITWQYKPLNHKLMHAAAQNLIGEHDFTSFRSIECQSKTPMRRLMHLNVTREGDLVIIDVKANAFLHHMVRNIAGVLMAVGSGRQQVEWTNEVLAAKDRRLGAETAPPYGLYLSEVIYPDEFEIQKP
ncbi:MAG: tRNA pseudouridine(38-40) synthase TruA [Legionella sp. 21-45-4]|nr:MAG: tRNA pseudouridine(38-40) synthase TruA [Legionella sp. 21-45-4]